MSENTNALSLSGAWEGKGLKPRSDVGINKLTGMKRHGVVVGIRSRVC
jgi:hypothetical protein